MKTLKNILSLLFVVLCFVGCETYGEPEMEKSAVAPLDGRWICMAYDYTEYQTNPSTAKPVEYFDIYASNTQANEDNKMWLNITNPLVDYPYIQAVSVKIDCSPSALTFGSQTTTVLAPARMFSQVYPGTVPTRSTAGQTVVVGEGRVVRDGYETPSSTAEKKYYSDSITFTLEVQGNPMYPVKYVVIGNRYTGWDSDYLKEADFINNY